MFTFMIWSILWIVSAFAFMFWFAKRLEEQHMDDENDDGK